MIRVSPLRITHLHRYVYDGDDEPRVCVGQVGDGDIRRYPPATYIPHTTVTQVDGVFCV